MKLCRKCNKEKDNSLFYKDKNHGDGMQSYCKECSIKDRLEWYRKNHERVNRERKKEYHQNIDKHKEHYRLNREYILGRQRNWRHRVKLEVISYYSKGLNACMCPSKKCGENRIEFLCIDHINGGGNKQRKEVGAGSMLSVWLRKNNFPPGYRILCYNCNCSLGHFGYCPHSNE